MVVTELTTFNIIPISHFLYNFDLGAQHLNSLSYRVTPVASLTQIWLQLNFNFSKETWITENITWMEHTHTHKKKPQVILSALCPLLCNSTWPQHTLQMFADHCGPRQTIPWETINQGLLQGEMYPIQTIFNHRSRDQLLEFRTSFYETISSEFLVQGNFKHTQFSWEHWHWRDSNSQPLAPKASTVSIELTWQVYNIHTLLLYTQEFTIATSPLLA